MAYAIAWNEAAPAGASVNASTIDTEFQNLKKSLRERMNDLTENTWETDANNPKTLSVSALAGTPNLAVVYTGANFSIASGGGVTIDFVQETLDTGSFHDNSTNPSRLTITTAAYYRLTISLEISIGATVPTVATLQLRKNGTKIAQTTKRHITASTVAAHTLSYIVLAAADDYYEAFVVQSSGDTWSTLDDAEEAWFMIERINGTT